MKRLTFLCIALCLGWFHMAQATNYYVKTTGDDSKDGLSEANAWETLLRACTSGVEVSAGDTVFIREGEYTHYEDSVGNVWIMPIGLSGTSGNPIVYRNYPGDGFWVLRGSQSEQVSPDIHYIHGINFQENSWITIDSARITNMHKWGIGIAGTNFEVKNCQFDSMANEAHQNSNPGIIVMETSFKCHQFGPILIDNCLFFYTTHSAVGVIYGYDSLVVSNCEFYDVGSAVTLKLGQSGCDSNIHIYNNFVWQTASPPSNASQGFLLGITSRAIDVYVHHNVIDLSHSSEYGGIVTSFWGGDGGGATWRRRYYIYNNTVNINGLDANIGNIEAYFSVSGDTTFHTDSFYLFNNVLVYPSEAAASGNAGCIYAHATASQLSGNDCVWGDYDFIIDTTTSHSIFLWDNAKDGTNEYTIGQYRANTPYADNTDTTSDTSGIFVDMENDDYRPVPGSPIETGGWGRYIHSSTGDSVITPTYRGAFAPTGAGHQLPTLPSRKRMPPP